MEYKTGSKAKSQGDQKRPEKFSKPISEDLRKFNDIQIEAHNKYRQMHQAEDVVYDEGLAQGAQQWAEKLAKEDKFYHSESDERYGAGENLAMYGSSDPNDKTLLTTACATDMWYDEVKDYDFGNPGFAMNTGHFTQVVWKGTKKVGFGYAGNYVVGRYEPSGNMMGDFETMVLPKN